MEMEMVCANVLASFTMFGECHAVGEWDVACVTCELDELGMFRIMFARVLVDVFVLLFIGTVHVHEAASAPVHDR